MESVLSGMGSEQFRHHPILKIIEAKGVKKETYDDLITVGFEAQQAVVLAAHMPDVDTKLDQLESRMDMKLDQLESRMDMKLDQLESRMDTKLDQMGNHMDQMENRMDAKLDRLESRIIRWMVGIFLTFLSAFALLLTAANFLLG